MSMRTASSFLVTIPNQEMESMAIREETRRDIGLLVVRLVVGASMMLFHGLGKLQAGPEGWAKTGAQMGNLGINFLPVFWGFMAMLAEFGGSLLLAAGLLFRPASAMLAFTMFVATLRHLSLPASDPNSGWKGASHALELLSVYVALLLTGPGRFRLGPGK
jgi:putative oxidoreductase